MNQTIESDLLEKEIQSIVRLAIPDLFSNLFSVFPNTNTNMWKINQLVSGTGIQTYNLRKMSLQYNPKTYLVEGDEQ